MTAHIDRDFHARQFAIGHTRYAYEDVVAVTAEWDAAKAEYVVLWADITALNVAYPHWDDPIWGTPEHLVPLLDALADDRNYVSDSLDVGSYSNEAFPVVSWRKQVKRLRAVTARLRKVLTAVTSPSATAA